MSRISQKFLELKGKTALVSYICAGDPNHEISLNILKNLPKKGVDIIELGIPFLDPAGDGPIIENASKRAISNGASLKKTLEMVKDFRKDDSKTPVILMTYYNPVFKFGIDKFFKEARENGIDGVLIVDLPLEEDDEILSAVKNSNIDLIQLIAPTTNEERIRKIAKNASGFLYLISMLGITGTKAASVTDNKINLEKLRRNSNLPVVIGFGIKEPKQAKEFSQIGVDGVVIGSAFVKDIDENFSANKSESEICNSVLEKIAEFSNALK
ncbi:MAG: tryptophan synthase subunit alpha [Rickettsiales bacterium]|nr:tryptophan synthase subunit alpha [Rickettsiales bacterium]